LISEIKAEMGRRDLKMSDLAELIGESKQYVGSRIGSGNPRTGKLVEINVADLYAIAGAMDLDPLDLFDRARQAAAGELAAKRRPSTAPAIQTRAARRRQGKPKMGDE
jgi:hypothetical protein